MAKGFEIAVVVAFVLCLSSVLSSVSAENFSVNNESDVVLSPASAPSFTDNGEQYTVEGRVYCDPCKVGYETKLSKPIEGVKVILECRERERRDLKMRELGDLKMRRQSVTDKMGHYKMSAEGDHGNEICEVQLDHSPNPECALKMHTNFARIVLTVSNSVKEPVRRVPPLGFMTKEAHPDCPDPGEGKDITDAPSPSPSP